MTTGARVDNPVPAGRRSSGLRAKRRGLLGHIGPGRAGTGGRLVREPRRLPESVSAEEISDFLADLRTYRDRAIVLLMALGGLRAAEVRSLRLADVDMGLRRVRVMGKGAGNGSSRSSGRSSPSSERTCVTSGRRAARPRSASWCSVVRRPVAR